ncbi:MAG: hypothetical protein QXU32_04905 [Nitrososphaerales archaeon]
MKSATSGNKGRFRSMHTVGAIIAVMALLGSAFLTYGGPAYAHSQTTHNADGTTKIYAVKASPLHLVFCTDHAVTMNLGAMVYDPVQNKMYRALYHIKSMPADSCHEWTASDFKWIPVGGRTYWFVVDTTETRAYEYYTSFVA